VSYVDAGYAIALGVLFAYAVSLVLRRRRWERALKISQMSQPSQPSQPHAAEDGAPAHGPRS
jgi:hypothetical protein